MSGILAQGPRAGLWGSIVGASSVIYGLWRLLSEEKIQRFIYVPLSLMFLLYSITLGILLVQVEDPSAYFWMLRHETDNWVLYIWWLYIVAACIALWLSFLLCLTLVVTFFSGFYFQKITLFLFKSRDVEPERAKITSSTVGIFWRSSAFGISASVLAYLGTLQGVGWVFSIPSIWVATMGFAHWAMDYSECISIRSEWPRTNRSTALGLGSIVCFGLFFPFLGLVILPASIIGACELHLVQRKRDTSASDSEHDLDGAAPTD